MCPGTSADHAGAAVAYRCTSAVTDVFGNVVVLREGRPRPAGSGLALARDDGNVGRAVIERLVQTVRPRSAP